MGVLGDVGVKVMCCQELLVFSLTGLLVIITPKQNSSSKGMLCCAFILLYTFDLYGCFQKTEHLSFCTNISTAINLKSMISL